MNTPVNIILGRFQPFTLGHLVCVEHAFKESCHSTVLCIIETPENKRDDRHPFTTNEIIPMIEKMIHESEEIIDYVLVKNADIAKIVEALNSKEYTLASWTCGTDRYAAYSRQCKGYWQKVGLPEEPKCIEVKRGDDDISASKVRQALKDNDLSEYKKLMPASWWSYFKTLQQIIIKISENT